MKTSPMRKGLLLLTGCLIASLVWAGSALAVPFTDTTLVRKYLGSASGPTATNVWKDVIDPASTGEFNLYGMDVEYLGGILSIVLDTSFPTSGAATLLTGDIKAYIADIRLAVNGGGYNYGIVLRDHDNWGAMRSYLTDKTANIGLHSVSSWDTSTDLYGYLPVVYGGTWGAISSPHAPNALSRVALVSSGLIDSGTIGSAVNASGHTIWTVTVDASSLGLNPGDSLTLFTAGMSCSNDAMVANFDIPNITVPEPATLLLLGCGLVGLAGFGRRMGFKKQ